MSQPPSYKETTVLALFFVLITILTYIFIELTNGTSVVHTLNSDSDQYFAYAKRLLGISAPTISTTPLHHELYLFRPIGYPALLATLLWLNNGILSGSSLIALHGAIFVTTITLLFLAMRKLIPLWGILASALLGLLLVGNYLPMVLTEWSVFCFLLLLGIQVKNSAIRPTIGNGIVTGLTASALALLRAEFFILFLITLIAIIIIPSGIKKIWRCGLLIGFLLALSSASYNLIHYNVFNVSIGDGSIACIALATGFPPQHVEGVLDSDLSALALGAQRIISEDLIEIIQLHADRAASVASHNFKLLEDQFITLPWQKVNAQGRAIAQATIQQNLTEYICIVLTNLCTLLWSLPILMLLVRKAPSSVQDRGYALYIAALSIVLLHFLRIGIMSFVNIIYARYYIISLSAALIMALLYFMSRRHTQPTSNKT